MVKNIDLLFEAVEKICSLSESGDFDPVKT